MRQLMLVTLICSLAGSGAVASSGHSVGDSMPSTPVAVSSAPRSDAPEQASVASPATAVRVQVDAWEISPDNERVAFWGLLTNVDRVPATRILVTASFYDANGALLAWGTAESLRPVVPAGEPSAFRGLVYGLDLARVAERAIAVQAQGMDPTALEARLFSDRVVVSAVSWTNHHLSGTVRNTSDAAIGPVFVVGIAHDARGRLLGVERIMAQPSLIPPGGTGTFDQYVFSADPPPAQVTVYGWGYRDWWP